MMQRQRLITLAVLLAIGGIGLWVATQEGKQPFQAELVEPFDRFEEAVTGRVTGLGLTWFEMRVVADQVSPPRYNIEVRESTTFSLIEPEHHTLRFNELEAGDRVVVYPTERRADLTREAFHVDVFK